MKKQDIHLQKIREMNVRRLRVLELQAAQFGINVPPHILLEIEDIKEKISNIDLHLKDDLIANEGYENSQKKSRS